MMGQKLYRAALLGGAAVSLGALLCVEPTQAATLVSTIYGVYDANSCGDSGACLSAPAGEPLATNCANCGTTRYDTPTLFINNNTGFSFTNATITLTAYQGINNGSVTVVSIGTIAANTLYAENWNTNGAGTGNPIPGSGSNTSANLYTYDYDDYYGGNTGNPACAAEGFGFCETPGNFDVTFSATWNNPAYGAGGTPIAAVFGPDNTQGNGNAAGMFVGWEGLDPTGLAETSFDDHSTSVSGVLANIFVGTPNSITGVPEPGTITLLAAGFGAVAGLRRRRRKAA